MNFANPALMVHILIQDYPDIAGIISNKIVTSLPGRKTADLAKVKFIVTDFKTVTGLSQIVWGNSTDRVECNLSDAEIRNMKVTEARELLLAVVLMFYHPEKLMGFTGAAACKGILKELGKVLQCDKSRLSQDITNAVSYYRRSYAGFKKEVDRIYDEVKLRRNYF